MLITSVGSLSALSGFGAFGAAEVALLMVALQYAALTPVWAVAAVVLPTDRRAVGAWALYSGGSAVALLLIVMGMHSADAPVRALGNMLVIAATLALQRGVWAFTGVRAWNKAQALMLAVAVLLSGWAALDPARIPLRIATVAAIWAGLYAWTAADVWRHTHRTVALGWSLLYAAPMALTALMLVLRSLRAAFSPDTVSAEVEQSTLLNVGSSLVGLVAALLLQMVLVSLVVSRLLGRLERLSRHDALTGLLNRHAIDELLAHEEQRARRLSSHVSGHVSGHGSGHVSGRIAVLMIDIDHFKRINDSEGHAVGDRALQHLSAVMRTQLREVDHLARWGGEEFLALLPATSGADAMVMAERLCERVRHLPLVNDDHRLALTASIGVAEWLGAQDTIAAMVGRADAALYEAKREGRDRVRRSTVDVLGRAA